MGLEEAFEVGLKRYVVPVRDDGSTPFKTRWASGAVAGLGLAGTAGQICEILLIVWCVGSNADAGAVQTACRDTAAHGGSSSVSL